MRFRRRTAGRYRKHEDLGERKPVPTSKPRPRPPYWVVPNVICDRNADRVRRGTVRTFRTGPQIIEVRYPHGAA